MQPCVFCDITDEKIPARRVYEDDHVIAFLDRRRIRPRHAMVIPRIHTDDFLDLPDDLAAHIAKVGNAIGSETRFRNSR